jgi:hypothetical protein
MVVVEMVVQQLNLQNNQNLRKKKVMSSKKNQLNGNLWDIK